jgi:hypothetical protein
MADLGQGPRRRPLTNPLRSPSAGQLFDGPGEPRERLGCARSGHFLPRERNAADALGRIGKRALAYMSTEFSCCTEKIEVYSPAPQSGGMGQGSVSKRANLAGDPRTMTLANFTPSMSLVRGTASQGA